MNYMGSTPDKSTSQQQQQTKKPYISYVATFECVTNPAWCLNSGASHNVTNNLNQLQQVNKYISETKLTVVNRHAIPIKHTSSITIPTSSKPIYLKNVIHCPQIAKNLISISQLTTQNNHYVEFDSDFVSVKDKTTRKDLLQVRIKDGLYQIEP